MDAISYISSQNLVHRDLKPDNIMFKENSTQPIIVDFGLVRNLSDTSLTKTWAIQGPGTPFFASPEQLNNQKQMIDWRCDQFALGVLLCIIRFDLHPYAHPNDSQFKIVERVANREFMHDSITAVLNKSAFPIILKMVSNWPVERFRTPEHLISAWGNLGV